MKNQTTESIVERSIIVELWTARVPRAGGFAEHHWLEINRASQIDRWEVWQEANHGGESWGHVHRNLLAPSEGVGNGPGRLLHRWTDLIASELARRIESTPTEYPWRDWYRVVPGPNSNTYVQWIIGEYYRLGWRGIGRGYASRG
ncbi:MAG: DUF3750 domain-containing protein [Planctomycetota bacterium]